MSDLHLRYLGNIEARLDSGQRLEIPLRKGQALLAYLALTPEATAPRSKLADLLWGDHGEKQAHNSLRQTLTILRKALEPVQERLLWADRQNIGLRRSEVEIDAVQFEDLINGNTLEGLTEAIALYRGDLLDGLDISEPEFENWLEDERRRYRDLMVRALSTLMEARRATGARQDAVALARRLLSLDPLQESVHRLLMELYGELGQRDAALQQYDRCRALLEAELGVAPEAETESLAQALRGNRPGVVSAPNDGVPSTGSAASTDEADEYETASAPLTPQPQRRWTEWGIAAVLVLMILAGVSLVWLKPWAPNVEPASVARMAYPLPDKPSIAVLPFANLSGDPEQAYFADGFTDDLITDLSKLSGLFVIARNSTLRYKAEPASIRQVAEDLGVRYVLEGSVRRTGEHVRINTQLIDAITGGHLWADRYDVPLSDVFAVQEQVNREVVAALRIKLTESEENERLRRGTESAEAYDALLKGREFLIRFTRNSLPFAVLYYEEAIRLDPDYAAAHTGLGVTYWVAADSDWADSLGLSSDEARAKARHHLAEGMKDPTPTAYFYATKTHSNEGRYEEAIAVARDMIARYPSDQVAYKALGRALNKAGRAAEAIEPLKLALRLDPYGDDLGWLSYRLGEAYYLSGHDAEAAEAFTRSAERNQNEWSYFFVAASYAQLGRLEVAREAMDRFNMILSDNGQDPYTVAAIEGWAFKNPADRLRVQEGARKAGMPEGVVSDLDLDLAQDISPDAMAGATTVDAKQAKVLIEQGAAVVDVRATQNWKIGHIPNAVHLPLFRDLTEAKLSDLVAKNQKVMFVGSGASSSGVARAVARAVSWGYSDVYYFRDGLAGWKAAGYPVQVPPK